MFVVTKSTKEGSEIPVLFVNKKDALEYKRRSALVDAFLSILGEEFALLLNETALDILKETFEDLQDGKIKENLKEEKERLIEKFMTFLSVRKSFFSDASDVIFLPTGERIYVQLFEVSEPTAIETCEGEDDGGCQNV